MLDRSSPERTSLDRVLESAARLQTLVPDTALVGRTAPAYHVGHRLSYGDDHVLAQLQSRFDLVLNALEREGGWLRNRVVPGKYS